jgi:hypothetical protein
VGSFFFKVVIRESDFLLHVTVKGVAKIARKLGFDYAEAVVRAFFFTLLSGWTSWKFALPKFNLISYLVTLDWV